MLSNYLSVLNKFSAG